MLSRFTVYFTRAVPWLRQTSTIAGIATLIGLAVALLTGEATWQAELPVAVGAVVAMVLPGHADAQSVLTRVAIDAVATANPLTRSQGIQALSKDIPEAIQVTLTAKETAA